MDTRGWALIASVFVGTSAFAQSSGATLRTVAEESDFKRTGRYDEVVRLCSAYQSTWPKSVRCFEFGRSPEGRPMLALALSSDGTLTAAAFNMAATSATRRPSAWASANSFLSIP